VDKSRAHPGGVSLVFDFCKVAEAKQNKKKNPFQIFGSDMTVMYQMAHYSKKKKKKKKKI